MHTDSHKHRAVGPCLLHSVIALNKRTVSLKVSALFVFSVFVVFEYHGLAQHVHLSYSSHYYVCRVSKNPLKNIKFWHLSVCDHDSFSMKRCSSFTLPWNWVCKYVLALLLMMQDWKSLFSSGSTHWFHCSYQVSTLLRMISTDMHTREHSSIRMWLTPQWPSLIQF